MANRIDFGDHPTFGIGGYVSTPGVNVLTATKYQLMFGTNLETVQIIASGSFQLTRFRNGSTPNPYTNISWPDQGFYPTLLLSSDKWAMEFDYLNTSSAQIRATLEGDTQEGTFTCYYVVLRTPIP